jgi:DNA-binding CsgD family transcriptional regulator
MEIGNLVKHGKTPKEIAELLNLSRRAIDFHRKNSRRKMGARDRKANLNRHLLCLN